MTLMPNEITADGKQAQCNSCGDTHRIEYFKGKDGKKIIRYQCPLWKTFAFIHVNPLRENLPIPLVESRAYKKEQSKTKQLQLNLPINRDKL